MSGNIVITGTITCAPGDLTMVANGLKDHIRLTRSEPGCLTFSIIQSPDDDCVFDVSERFVDRAAFEVHTVRTRASDWWAMSQHIPRQMDVTEE